MPELRGHTARPRGAGPWPGVVMLHEAWGPEGICQRTRTARERSVWRASAWVVVSR